jgi:hypothetical protein
MKFNIKKFETTIDLICTEFHSQNKISIIKMDCGKFLEIIQSNQCHLFNYNLYCLCIIYLHLKPNVKQLFRINILFPYIKLKKDPTFHHISQCFKKIEETLHLHNYSYSFSDYLEIYHNEYNLLNKSYPVLRNEIEKMPFEPKIQFVIYFDLICRMNYVIERVSLKKICEELSIPMLKIKKIVRNFLNDQKNILFHVN